MAELRIAKFDDDLMARVKAGAALAQCTVKEFITALLRDALKRRAGRQNGKAVTGAMARFRAGSQGYEREIPVNGKRKRG